MNELTINKNFTNDNAITMTTVEIAEQTGKQHRHVKRDVEKMLIELYGSEDMLTFGHIYYDKYNREQTCYRLPKREVLILIAGYSIHLRAKIIDRIEELEKQVKNKYAMIPNFENPIEAAEAWIKEKKVNLLLTETLEKNKDKIEYYDAVMDSNDCTEVSTAAKTLNFEIGRNKVFKLLRKSGYLKANNEPYQQYCGNKKYFRMVQKHYYNKEGKSKTYYQTQILPKGIELIKNLYLKSNPEYQINDINEILEIAKNMTITSGNSQLTKQTEMFV